MRVINLYALCFLVFFCILSCKKTSNHNNSSKVTHYYFIRHAEKDNSNALNHNPHITGIGKQRTEKWNLLFSDIAFDAIYSTNYYRTKETAYPMALKNNLNITIYNPSNFQLPKFLSDTKGKNILIVGHSNTTPKLVNDIIKNVKYDTILKSV